MSLVAGLRLDQLVDLTAFLKYIARFKGQG